MADYIDREILCQAYIHIESDLNDQQLADLKKPWNFMFLPGADSSFMKMSRLR